MEKKPLQPTAEKNFGRGERAKEGWKPLVEGELTGNAQAAEEVLAEAEENFETEGGADLEKIGSARKKIREMGGGEGEIDLGQVAREAFQHHIELQERADKKLEELKAQKENLSPFGRLVQWWKKHPLDKEIAQWEERKKRLENRI